MPKRTIAGRLGVAACFAFTALGTIGALATPGAHAETAAEAVYGRVASFDARTQLIVVDGRTYALPSGARVEWQGGRAADRTAIAPRMHVSLSLVASTAEDDVPQVRTLTLHMD